MPKISDYPDAVTVVGADLLPIVHAGVNKKATVTELLAAAGISATETANTVYAGPTTGSPAAATFRALVAADVPNLDAAKVTTGQLALARGGTGADLSATGGTHQVLRQSTMGGAITVSALAAADLPVFIASGGSHAAGAVPDPGSSSGTTKFLREDASWQVPPGGMAIGGAVSGGTATSVLYVDGSGNLAQSANLTWNPAGNGLVVTDGTYTSKITIPGSVAAQFFGPGPINATFCTATRAGYFSDGTYTVAIADGSSAGNFGDGTRTVKICDGINNVTYGPGTPSDWNGTAPTDVWVALDRCATLLKALNGGTGP